MNYWLILIIAIALSNSVFTTPQRQWNWNSVGNRIMKSRNELEVTIDATFLCDDKSYFKTILRHQVLPINISCDEIIITRSSARWTGYGARANDASIALNIGVGLRAIVDNEGVEKRRILGTISGGECDGAFVFHEKTVYPTQGSCDSPNGITQLKSNEGVVALRGKCESTCYGMDTVSYSPGKTSKYQSNGMNTLTYSPGKTNNYQNNGYPYIK